MTRAILLAIAVLVASLDAARAHESRPAYLEIKETSPDTYAVLWKVPARGPDMRLSLDVVFPAATETIIKPLARITGGAYVEKRTIRRLGGLAGQKLSIDGLAATKVDALIRLTPLDGGTITVRATPDAPTVTIPADPSASQVIRTYTVLGIEHILFGIDHLLFVLALVLLVKGWRRLLGTITAFTVAHSITLAAATLGFVHVPGPPVEACIALSIVFVAAEIVRSHERKGHGHPARVLRLDDGRDARAPLVERAPWLIAFAFGLIHGLGFAGALSEIGLPQQAIPLALLFFNVGVEFGQIAFVLVVLAVLWVASRLPGPRPIWTWRIAPYAIGITATFWVIERTAAFF